MAFLAWDQLLAMGFAAPGEDVRISEHSSIHNVAAISLGSGVRIDDFCVLSAGVGGSAWETVCTSAPMRHGLVPGGSPCRMSRAGSPITRARTNHPGHPAPPVRLAWPGTEWTPGGDQSK